MTYSSRNCLISTGVGRVELWDRFSKRLSSAMSLRTSLWSLLQKEHRRTSGSPFFLDTLAPVLARSLQSLHALRDHLIDDTVLAGDFGGHDEVSLHVILDFGDVLSGVLRQNLVQALARAQDLLRLNVDVGGLARNTSRRLVDDDPGVRESETLSRRSRREDHGGHARCLADAVCRHVGANELQGVVDGEPRGHNSSRTIDVDRNLLLRILRLEKQELGHDQVRQIVFDGSSNEDDVVFE